MNRGARVHDLHGVGEAESLAIPHHRDARPGRANLSTRELGDSRFDRVFGPGLENLFLDLGKHSVFHRLGRGLRRLPAPGW